MIKDVRVEDIFRNEKPEKQKKEKRQFKLIHNDGQPVRLHAESKKERRAKKKALAAIKRNKRLIEKIRKEND